MRSRCICCGEHLYAGEHHVGLSQCNYILSRRRCRAHVALFGTIMSTWEFAYYNASQSVQDGQHCFVPECCYAA